MYTGPHIIKDGLVFGYDTGYGIADNDTATRFYTGEPAVNLWDSLLNTQSLRTHTKHYWNGKKWTEDATYTHPGVDGPKDVYLGLVFKHVSGALNSSWSGTSYGYMLRDIACTNGATMTMSSWIYASSDCNVDSIPAVIEGESGGESTVTGYPASYDLNNKGTWQVTAKKAISDGNTRFIPLYPRKNGVTDGSFAGFFMWALPQVTYGDRVVTPIQPGATRSSTASLIDLKETTDIDVSNVSFDSTGQPTFDETDDHITGTLPMNGLGAPHTIEMVFSCNVNQGSIGSRKDPFTIGNSSTHQYSALDVNSSYMNWYFYSRDTTFTNSPLMVANKFYHMVLSYAGGASNNTNKKVWLNGVQQTLSAGSSETPLLPNNPSFSVGRDRGRNTAYWPGKIPVWKVYQKALSATEVQQNYNAYKNRFDI